MRRKFLAAAAAAVVGVSGSVAVDVAVGAEPASPQATWCASPERGVVVMGDSSTTGYGTTGYVDGTQGGDEYYQPTYSGWINGLKQVWPEADWYVASRNGAMSSDYLPNGRFEKTREAIAEVEARQPSLVIITTLGNDYVIDRPPDEYQENLEQIVEGVREAAPDTSIVLVTMWRFDFKLDTSEPNFEFDSYAERMQQVADEHDLTWVDLREHMHNAWEHPETGLYHADEYGPGQAIHTTDAGNWVQKAVMRHALTCVNGVLAYG